MAVIVVIGAGVSGLTSALLLAKNDKDNAITVVAKHMPGDYDSEYTSPFAGANVLPMSIPADSQWERETWPELKRLAIEVPEAGIHLQKSRVYRREKDLAEVKKSVLSDGLFLEKPWFADLFDDYRELSREELPAGVRSGCEFGSVCINTALYLPWLIGQLRANGVVLRRGTVKHVSEAAGMSHAGRRADIVVNCTGVLACRLGGVEDGKVKPARGQVVLVRNELSPMVTISGTDDAEDELCYAMMRAAGGGTILGGTYQIGNWDGNPDPNTALRIMRRATELVPELAGGKGVAGLDVVRHAVGLRPYRVGGVRLEKERMDGGVWVVHNYGHSGWGYQGSYGCARRVVELVGEVGAVKARL